MATINRTIETEQDRDLLIKFIQGRKLPLTVSIADGKQRSTEQNKLQRLWMVEIATQMGDRTPEEVRGYCKLTIGVPLLRAENDVFRMKYDEVVRPLTYEQKLSIMMEPLDMPVTRIMTTRQKTAYLDAIHRHFSAEGVALTDPGDLLFKARAAA